MGIDTTGPETGPDQGGQDTGSLDTEDVPPLEARLATLQTEIRRQRRTVADLSANTGLLDQMPRLRRDGMDSFGVGFVRGLIVDLGLFVLGVVVLVARR